MFTKEKISYMMDVLNSPLFKQGFFEFFTKMQLEGIEAARKFWGLNSDKNTALPNAVEMYEKMIDFYITLGFIPRTKYDNMLKENERLREENRFLRETISELQINIFKEGGEKVQQSWQTIIDKQLEMNKEIANNFFELFRQLKGTGQ